MYYMYSTLSKLDNICLFPEVARLVHPWPQGYHLNKASLYDLLPRAFYLFLFCLRACPESMATRASTAPSRVSAGAGGQREDWQERGRRFRG